MRWRAGGGGGGVAGRVGAGRAVWGRAVWGWAGWDAGGPGGRGVVRTFIQPERVFVRRSKERAPKPGRIGNLEKSCSSWKNSCFHMEKSGKMLEKKNSIFLAGKE